MPAPEFTAKDIHVDNDQSVVKIAWADGHASEIPTRRLRGYCPCAECQGHGGAVKWIDNQVTGIFSADLVGAYAINFQFSDGHAVGIFRWEALRKLDPVEEAKWGVPEVAMNSL